MHSELLIQSSTCTLNVVLISLQPVFHTAVSCMVRHHGAATQRTLHGTGAASNMISVLSIIKLPAFLKFPDHWIIILTALDTWQTVIFPEWMEGCDRKISRTSLTLVWECACLQETIVEALTGFRPSKLFLLVPSDLFQSLPVVYIIYWNISETPPTKRRLSLPGIREVKHFSYKLLFCSNTKNLYWGWFILSVFP